MAVASDDFASWLTQADIPQQRLTAELQALLAAVFRFRQSQGSDYYSTRLLSHFLLHADTGLKVAQIARLLGISRPNASKQQKLSSKAAIKQAHHRMDGRPHGKLLPRYAGPIAAYLVSHPDCSRAELLDFIKRTFGVKVSRIALYKFLKKYGLQDVAAASQPPAQAGEAVDIATRELEESSAAAVPTPVVAPAPEVKPAPQGVSGPLIAEPPLPAPATASPPLSLPAATVAAAVLLPAPPAPPFSTDERNTPAPSF
jgi:transposase